MVNNAVYLTLLEEARRDYFTDLGLVTDNQFPFVLMQTNVRFLATTRGGDELEIELKTVALGQSSIRQLARIRETSAAGVVLEAEVLLVSWNNEERRKSPMSADFRRRVASFEGELELGASASQASPAGQRDSTAADTSSGSGAPGSTTG